MQLYVPLVANAVNRWLLLALRWTLLTLDKTELDRLQAEWEGLVLAWGSALYGERWAAWAKEFPELSSRYQELTSFVDMIDEMACLKLGDKIFDRLSEQMEDLKKCPDLRKEIMSGVWSRPGPHPPPCSSGAVGTDLSADELRRFEFLGLPASARQFSGPAYSGAPISKSPADISRYVQMLRKQVGKYAATELAGAIGRDAKGSIQGAATLERLRLPATVNSALHAAGLVTCQDVFSILGELNRGAAEKGSVDLVRDVGVPLAVAGFPLMGRGNALWRELVERSWRRFFEHICFKDDPCFQTLKTRSAGADNADACAFALHKGADSASRRRVVQALAFFSPRRSLAVGELPADAAVQMSSDDPDAAGVLENLSQRQFNFFRRLFLVKFVRAWGIGWIDAEFDAWKQRHGASAVSGVGKLLEEELDPSSIAEVEATLMKALDDLFCGLIRKAATDGRRLKAMGELWRWFKLGLEDRACLFLEILHGTVPTDIRDGTSANVFRDLMTAVTGKSLPVIPVRRTMPGRIPAASTRAKKPQ